MLTFKEIDLSTFSKELSVFTVKNDEQAIALEEFVAALIEQEYEGDTTLRPIIDFIEMALDKYKTTLPEEIAAGAEVLSFLMKQHGHMQNDLSHIISCSTINMFLNGQMKLNREQMERLGKLYHISPTVFF